MLVLAACGSAEPAPVPTEVPTRTPFPTFTPRPTQVALIIIAPSPSATVPPTRTPLPTATPWWTETPSPTVTLPPTPIPTASSVPPQQSVTQVAAQSTSRQSTNQNTGQGTVLYRTLTPDEDGLLRTFIGQTLAYEMMRDLATRIQSGQADGMEGFVGLAMIGGILQGIDPVLERAYVPPLLEYAGIAKGQQDKIRGIAARWLDKEIDSGIVLTELQGFSPQDNAVRFGEFLKSVGYSPEEINAAITRMEEDLQAAFEGMEQASN